MHIGYIVNTYPRPSHSFIRREIHALERRGVQITRFAMRGDRAALVDPADLAEHDRTEFVLAQGASGLALTLLRHIRRNPLQVFAALRLALRLGRRGGSVGRHMIYLAEAGYIAAQSRVAGIDHLHAHFGTNSTTVALLAQALGGPTFSFTTHGPEEFDNPVGLALDEKTHRAAFSVAISCYGRSQLCRWAAYPDWPRLHVVHCGIEPSAFSNPSPLPPGPETRMVCIGRLVEQKGQLALIDALALALPANPGLRLVLVGDGELRAPIEAAIAAQGIGHAVTITGWVGEARVRDELSAAHALILPSFAEGLPMVVMEAMAAARPVIATCIAGIPELVRPGETGWLVPAGDVRSLADAMAILAQTPAAWLAEMGQAGRVRVLKRHDIDTESEKLVGLFEAAIRE